MWTWTWQPEHRFLLGSYNDKFLTRDGRQSVELLRSDLYARAWPHVTLTQTAPAAKYFENTKGGLRYATTPGAGGTGEHGHSRMFDDPMSAGDKHSEPVKTAVSQWWHGVMTSRQASGIPFGSLGIMQRLTKDDLAEECLNDGYEHLCIPAEYVPNASWDRGCSLGKLDPRTEPGELMWPELFPKDKLDEKKRGLKNRADAEAQYQQNPVPDTGGIIERPWVKRWSNDPKSDFALPPANKMRWITSWDLAFDGEKDSHSRVAGGLFAACKVNGLKRFICVSAFAKHMNYPQTKKRIRQLLQGYEDEKLRKRYAPVPLWSNARKHVIEKKANGAAMLAELRNEIRGLKAVTPSDSKGDRLVLHSDKFEAGEVWLPPEVVCPQIAELEDELVFFPNGDFDDFVDIVTQALDELDKPMAGYWDNLAKLAEQMNVRR
jgi:predicted phage terminase large subunit-like protein